MLFIGKAWRPGAPKFRIKFDHSAIAAVQKRRAVRWHGAIPCKWATAAGRLLCNDTKKPWQNPILPRPLFPCPICALKARTHHQVFWLMQPGADRKNKINAPRGFLPSHGLSPTMAAFRRKAAQPQIQLRGKPRIPTGFLLIPPPRSAAARGTMIRCMLLYVQNTTPGSNCQCLFPSLPLFCNRPPKNPHREPPSGAKHRRGVGAGVSPHPFRKEIK